MPYVIYNQQPDCWFCGEKTKDNRNVVIFFELNGASYGVSRVHTACDACVTMYHRGETGVPNAIEMMTVGK